MTLLEIGRLIFDKYQRNAELVEDVLKDKTNEIAGYEHEINLLQGEIDSLKTVHDPDMPTSQKADAKAGYAPTPGFECSRCHAPANKEKAFCAACGEPLKNNGSDEGTIDVEPNGDNN